MAHPEAAAQFVKNGERMQWHDKALWFVREKRDKAAQSVPEWERLRDAASAIKGHALSQLGDYLTEFADQAAANGIQVHWAVDAEEHNRIVHKILKKHKVSRVVKSKSMLTEECHLNPYLEKRGLEVIDTDLGERIIQLRDEPPSHIVMPAIHLKKEEVGELFHEKMGTPKGESDPQALTEAARQDLRAKFLKAEAGLTGVNFAVAETGEIVICTNEGNADLGVSLPPLHIASMGIEKIIPRREDLGVFLRLLARSATGQPITTYSTHLSGPKKGGEMHVVIVDNGRTRHLASPEFRKSLQCIRCGACMNTCPVYRRSGGHSYDYVSPGPIGAVTAPIRDPGTHASLPFACTLCGSCSNVCPVQINLHEQHLTWRSKLAKKGGVSLDKRVAMRISSKIFSNPAVFRASAGAGRFFMRILPRAILYSRLNPWGRQRELPPAPKQSFRDWYKDEDHV